MFAAAVLRTSIINPQSFKQHSSDLSLKQNYTVLPGELRGISSSSPNNFHQQSSQPHEGLLSASSSTQHSSTQNFEQVFTELPAAVPRTSVRSSYRLKQNYASLKQHSSAVTLALRASSSSLKNFSRNSRSLKQDNAELPAGLLRASISTPQHLQHHSESPAGLFRGASSSSPQNFHQPSCAASS